MACSRASAGMFGAGSEVLSGKILYEAAPHAPAVWRDLHANCLLGAAGQQGSGECRLADGQLRHLEWRMEPWHEAGGAIGGSVLFLQDVTAEAAKQKQLRLLADGLDHAGFGVAISDGKTNKIVYANPAFATQHRLPPGSVTGMSALDTYPAAERANMLPRLQAAGSNATVALEVERLRGDGTTFPSLTAISLVSEPDGQTQYRVGTVIDATALKQAEAARHAAEGELATLVDLAPGVLYLARVSCSGIELLRAHGNFRQISETGGAEVVGRLLNGLECGALLHRLAALPGDEPQSADWEIEEPNGRKRQVRNNARVTKRDDAVEITGYLTDVTLEIAARQTVPPANPIATLGQMAAGAASHIGAAALRQFIETLPAGLAILDRHMTYIAASRDYRALLGLQDENLTGRSYYEIFPEMTAERRESHRRCLAGETRQVQADPYLRANGQFAFWDWEMRPWYQADGQTGGVAITIRNVTDAVQAQFDLRRYADGLQNANIGIGIADAATGALIYVNPEFAALHHTTPEEMRRMPVLDIYAESEQAHVREMVRQAESGGRVVFEAQRMRADGTSFPALVALTYVTGKSGLPPYRIGTVIDLTELRRAEAERRVALGELATLLEFGPGILCRKRISADGMEAVEIHGNRRRLAAPGETPDDVDAMVMRVLRHPDTAALLQRLSQQPESDTGSVDVAISAPGAPERWIRNAVHVIGRGPAGTELAGYMTDVTWDMQEKQRLDRTATLVTLGEMATSMAHELRQPLTSISYAAQNIVHMMSDIPGQADRFPAKLTKIVAEAQRASKLIDHMCIFGRNETRAKSLVSWQDSLNGALELLAPRLKDFTVRNALPPGLPPVPGVPILMEQALINLIGNAFDAYESAGTPGQRVVTVSGHVDGGTVVLQVADHAGGIPDDVLPRIFQPFVTTKPSGKGTGLGLAVVYGTATDMGGTLTVRNADGGAVFELRAPLAAEGAA